MKLPVSDRNDEMFSAVTPSKWERIFDRYLVAAVGLLLLASTVGIVAKLHDVSETLIQRTALRDAQSYSEAVAEFRTLYTSEVVGRLAPMGVKVSHDYQNHAGAIPLPATLSKLLGDRLGKGVSRSETRLYSNYPFPWRADSGGPKNEFEVRALQKLDVSPEDPYFEFSEIEGEPFLQYAVADRMRASCVNCHNTHADSPKTDWKVGDVRGALAVRIPLADVVAHSNSQIKGTLGVFLAAGLVTLGSFGTLVFRFQRRVAQTRASRNILAQAGNELRFAKEQLEDAHAKLHARASELERSRRAGLNLMADMRGEMVERKRLTDQLEDLAYNDSLTQLPNRAAILRAIQNVIDRNDGTNFALLFLDFDRFKLVNDSLGHDVGDRLLKEIANRLRHTLRSTDTVLPGRLGGDEFVVLLDRLRETEDAVCVAERLLKAFKRPYELDGHTVYSTASIGIAPSERPYKTASEMLRDADLAMYEAKGTDTGSYVVFDQAMYETAQVRLDLERRLRESLNSNEFFLAYQPILSLDSFKLAGVEALVRWNHPEMGLVGPERFIPIAEETGIIVPLGQWVFEEACRQFAQWHDELGEMAPACVHVNLSRKQLVLPNLSEVVQATLERFRIPPQSVHLEVTESAVMEDRDLAIELMRELRELGVRVDMDDFGTGHSSLSCLLEFPLDTLKIDREFLTDIGSSPEHMALLQAIVTLSREVGLSVVVEGIENETQFRCVRDLGCDFGQGHYFSQALLAGDLMEFITHPWGRDSPIKDGETFNDDPSAACSL